MEQSACTKRPEPVSQPKACDGRCQGNCGKAPRLWVLVACEGRIGVLHKKGDSLSKAGMYGSLEEFCALMRDATDMRRFDQLIMVGARGDIGWLQAALPEDAGSRIMAEMTYPLLPDWFAEADMKQLIAALNPLLP